VQVRTPPKFHPPGAELPAARGGRSTNRMNGAGYRSPRRPLD
jgi:hypothetical protein